MATLEELEARVGNIEAQMANALSAMSASMAALETRVDFPSEVVEAEPTEEEVPHLTPVGYLHITIQRDESGGGWSAAVTDNGYADKTDFALLDMDGTFTTVNGTTAIGGSGSATSGDRDPPYSGPDIEWHFQVGKNGTPIPGTQMTLTDRFVSASFEV